MLIARFIQVIINQIKKIIQTIDQISLSLNILYQKIKVLNIKLNQKIRFHKIKIKLFSWKNLFSFTISDIFNYQKNQNKTMKYGYLYIIK